MSRAMQIRHVHADITIRRPGIAPYILPLDIVTYPAQHPEAGRDVLADVAPNAILPGDGGLPCYFWDRDWIDPKLPHPSR